MRKIFLLSLSLLLFNCSSLSDEQSKVIDDFLCHDWIGIRYTNFSNESQKNSVILKISKDSNNNLVYNSTRNVYWTNYYKQVVQNKNYISNGSVKYEYDENESELKIRLIKEDGDLFKELNIEIPFDSIINKLGRQTKVRETQKDFLDKTMFNPEVLGHDNKTFLFFGEDFFNGLTKEYGLNHSDFSFENHQIKGWLFRYGQRKFKYIDLFESYELKTQRKLDNIKVVVNGRAGVSFGNSGEVEREVEKSQFEFVDSNVYGINDLFNTKSIYLDEIKSKLDKIGFKTFTHEYTNEMIYSIFRDSNSKDIIYIKIESKDDPRFYIIFLKKI